MATGKPLDPSIANDQQLRQDYAYDESRPDRTANEELDLDDEYSQLSGIVDPRVLVTTSRDASTRLSAFAKEIRLLLPGTYGEPLHIRNRSTHYPSLFIHMLTDLQYVLTSHIYSCPLRRCDCESRRRLSIQNTNASERPP